jgi:uncharacterized protein (TIGR00369 family)
VAVRELPDSMPDLDTYLGMRIESASGDRVVLRWQVRPELCQPHGLVHGGTYCAAVEAAASIGAALWFSDMGGEHGRVVGVSNQTDFYRAVTSGELAAEALPVHRGRSQQVWRVRVTDDRDRLVAEGRVRLQNLNDPHRGPGR